MMNSMSCSRRRWGQESRHQPSLAQRDPNAKCPNDGAMSLRPEERWLSPYPQEPPRRNLSDPVAGPSGSVDGLTES